VATRRIAVSRRLVPTVGLLTACALAFPAGAAIAAPHPSAQQIQRKLNKLNSTADHIVDQYNQDRVDVGKANKTYQKLNKSAKKDEKVVGRMRGKIAMMASVAYQDGNLTATPSTMFADGNPQKVLDQLASLDHLSSSQMASIRTFLNSDAKLRRDRDQAKRKLDDARKSLKKVRGKRSQIQKLIKQQKHLLSQLPPQDRPQAPGSTGGHYNGPASGSARAALNYAYAQKGKPYVYGGTGPGGYDCSGLTMMSWRAAGVSLPRTSQAQYNAGHHVDQSQLQPGDLVFFDGLGHVGMWVGGGDIIHAPHTGAYVEVVPFSSMASSYVGAVRP
jgi:cell wall-associated NlpC family hydrolase